ncbi:exonuclease subunit SbcD [Mariniblastus sp.]|nr:exonuclease subunit SbcD [Mariniblastus sp.]
MPKQLQLDIGPDDEPDQAKEEKEVTRNEASHEEAAQEAATDDGAGRYRVLHTADWHLGKSLDRLSREDEHQRFLDWLLETIQEQKIDCLLVAGDIFDSPRPPQSAERMYFSFLARLHKETNCVAVITSGNHDSPRHLDAPSRALRALDVHVIGELPTDVNDCVIALPNADAPQLLIAAMPFLRDRDIRTGRLGESTDQIAKALQAGIKQSYQNALEACEAIRKQHPQAAMMAAGHLTVSGCSTKEKKLPDGELPIHIGGLGEISPETFPSDFGYVALGHIHRSQSFNKNDAGLPHVAYSGSPIPLSFSEAGHQKTVQVLDFAAGKFVAQTKLAIPTCRELVQLKVTREELEKQLKSFAPPTTELETWVELVIETTREHESLNELVESLTSESGYRIVKTAAQWVGENARLSENDLGLTTAELENVLEDPRRVFSLRLDQEVDLEDGERLQLQTAFDELLDLHTHSEQDGMPEADAPAPKMLAGKAVPS